MGGRLTKAQIVVIGAMAFGLTFLVLCLGGFVPFCKSSGSKIKKMTVWGVFDNRTVLETGLNEFVNLHGGLEITYKKIPVDEYEKELVNELAAGRGPDVVYIQNAWLPKYEDKLQPISDEVISIVDLRREFPDVVETDFAPDGDIYALPLYLDTLALYYNKDVFNSAGLTRPPKTWEEFQDYVKKISRIDATGEILRSAAAMGTARNINRSTDILNLLMLQAGAKMVNRDDEIATFGNIRFIEGAGDINPGLEALTFYTDFANPLKSVYTWNDDQDYSIDAFYAGKTAMMINYSHHIQTLHDKSPSLNFGIAPIPQPKNQSKLVNYPNYWGLAVTKKAGKTSELAFEFVRFMTNQANSQIYAQLTEKPVARRDLVEWQRTDPELGVFSLQGLTAISWWQKDNLIIEQIFANMIESVIKDGNAPAKALSDAEEQVSVLMQKQSP